LFIEYICAALIAAGGALLGYALDGGRGCAVGALAGLMLFLSLKLLMNARGTGGAVHALSRPASGSGLRAQVRLTGRRALGDGTLDGQRARHIRRFWRYHTEDQTLLFVRLRAGGLYCLYMRKAGHGQGARWVVRKVEGGEFGKFSDESSRLWHGIEH
jgi:hypothetical protein